MSTVAPRTVWRGTLALVVLAAGVAAFPRPGAAVCSVFDRHPCMPFSCSVFHRGPCIPDIEYPIGEDLQLTIESRAADHAEPPPADKPIGTIRAMFAALRGCWQPPAENDARAGTEMSIRFAFKGTGEIIAPPRVRRASSETARRGRGRGRRSALGFALRLAGSSRDRNRYARDSR